MTPDPSHCVHAQKSFYPKDGLRRYRIVYTIAELGGSIVSQYDAISEYLKCYKHTMDIKSSQPVTSSCMYNLIYWVYGKLPSL